MGFFFSFPCSWLAFYCFIFIFARRDYSAAPILHFEISILQLCVPLLSAISGLFSVFSTLEVVNLNIDIWNKFAKSANLVNESHLEMAVRAS
jgi:hypothetical protein